MKQSKGVKELSDNPNYSVTPRIVKGGHADETKPFYSKEPFVVVGDGGGSIGDIPDGSITTEKFADDAKVPFAGKADEANSVEWSSVQDKPDVYAPEQHTHPIEQVQDLQQKLDDKLSKTGGTVTGGVQLDNGLTFGDVSVNSPTDLSKHIKLHSDEWGISIEKGKFNFVTDDYKNNYGFNFYHGTTKIASIHKSITDSKSLTTKEYVDGVVSNLLADVNPIADPSTATTEDIANKVNEILTALKG